ncbi:hypothetical protein V6N11_079229 [Hibiscus sabdariffa]|uniref:Uncharacterized protein n=1 Tax=Hibiscus sabdariffa TaxID=183260 RepID=A0ABR2RUS2_9ROSI
MDKFCCKFCYSVPLEIMPSGEFEPFVQNNLMRSGTYGTMQIHGTWKHMSAFSSRGLLSVDNYVESLVLLDKTVDVRCDSDVNQPIYSSDSGESNGGESGVASDRRVM